MFPVLGAAPLDSIWIPGVIVVLTAAFILHIFFGTDYTITPQNRLKIHCGIIYNKELDIVKIVSIRPTRSIISAPAASLDRLEIRFGKFDSVVVSPKDQEGFISALQKINPEISWIKDKEELETSPQ